MRWSFLLAALAATAAAAEPAPSDATWSLGSGVLVMTAPALPGLAVGVSVEGLRTLRGPWFAGVRVAVASAEDANEAWQLDHRHWLAAGALGARLRAGAGLLSARLEAGVLGVREDARRQQFDRLVAARVPDVERFAGSAGPWLAMSFAVAVDVTPGWALALDAGPSATWQRVNGAGRVRGGLTGGLGVVHAF